MKHSIDLITRIKYLPAFLLSLLPFWALYVLSDFGRLVLFHLVRYRRKVVAENIRIAFPEKSRKERSIIEKDFYKNFCDTMLETSKLLTISEKQIHRRYRITNPEVLKALHEKGKSVIMYGGHNGNWEWYSSIPGQIPHKMISLYQPLSNKYFDGLMKTIRSRFGMHCVESQKGYRAIMDYTAQNTLTLSLVIGDQRPAANSPKHWVEFFKQNTAFLVGADRIAKKSNQAVIFPNVRKKRRGYYELECILLSENASEVEGHEIIDKYAKILEKSILESPPIWLWSHNRWKKVGEPNPAASAASTKVNDEVTAS